MGGDGFGHILLASEIILFAFGLVVEVASVFNAHLIPLLWLVDAIALGDDLLCNSHCASGAVRSGRMRGRVEFGWKWSQVRRERGTKNPFDAGFGI